MKVPFFDLKSKLSAYQPAFQAALSQLIEHSEYILGKELLLFEERLSRYLSEGLNEPCHAIGVANGTDALTLSLQAFNIGKGDEVITTPMSYLASSSAIVLTGATPTFVDVDETLNLDPEEVVKAITPNTKAILAVHLAGNPANIRALRAIANDYQLYLIEDCAQAFGSQIDGQCCGTFGDIAGFSFHPLKTLGALGDAGAVIAASEPSDALISSKGATHYRDWLRVARNHGHTSRDDAAFFSKNSRLDTLQAAFLIPMLADYPSYLNRRIEQADYYTQQLTCSELQDVVTTPIFNPSNRHVYGMYVIRTTQRDRLQQHLLQAGIDAKIHYPILIPDLEASRHTTRFAGPLPRARTAVKEILSLPIGEHLNNQQLDYVIEAIKAFYKNSLHQR